MTHIWGSCLGFMTGLLVVVISHIAPHPPSTDLMWKVVKVCLVSLGMPILMSLDSSTVVAVAAWLHPINQWFMFGKG